MWQGYKIPPTVIPTVDRIRRLSMKVIERHGDRFTTDFDENKKILTQLTVIRSKGLKNELAGYITKYLKKQADTKQSKLEEEEEEEVEQVEAQETQQEATEVQEEAEQEEEESEPQEILMESQNQESS